MVFGDVINFFEATPSHADKHLTKLWKIMADIKQVSEKKNILNKSFSFLYTDSKF